MKIEKINLRDFKALCLLQKEYKASIGETIEESFDFNVLKEAIYSEQIEFYGAIENEELIGMCSISRIFSTFKYSIVGVFEDFFIKPEFRHKGIARKLVSYAYESSKIDSLTVGAADCDVEMYKSIGFTISLGNMLAMGY